VLALGGIPVQLSKSNVVGWVFDFQKPSVLNFFEILETRVQPSGFSKPLKQPTVFTK